MKAKSKSRKRLLAEDSESKQHLGKKMFRVVHEETENKFNTAKEGLKRQTSTSFASKHTMKGSGIGMLVFWIIVFISQAVGITCIGLVIHFANLYKGFSWSNNAELQFNYHPVFMIIGLIFFYGDAIIVYRVFSFLPKTILKILHAVLHGGAIICASIALVAVFENHRRTNRADLYSLHSWIGLATFVLFGVQYTSGFISFLYPGVPQSYRSATMPFHRFFGVGIFLMAIASALMGLTEKLIWTNGYLSNNTIPEGAVGNALGMLLIVFGFLIVYLATNHSYQRKPLPSEVPSRTHSNGAPMN